MANEMAHYATACWDAGIHNSTGWLGVTGRPPVVRQAFKERICVSKERRLRIGTSNNFGQIVKAGHAGRHPRMR